MQNFEILLYWVILTWGMSPSGLNGMECCSQFFLWPAQYGSNRFELQDCQSQFIPWVILAWGMSPSGLNSCQSLDETGLAEVGVTEIREGLLSGRTYRVAPFCILYPNFRGWSWTVDNEEDSAGNEQDNEFDKRTDGCSCEELRGKVRVNNLFSN